MKDITTYINEKLNPGYVNEGPGAGVDGDVTGDLKFSVEFKNGKATLNEWKLDVDEFNISSYDMNFGLNVSKDSMKMEVFGKTPKFQSGSYVLPKMDVTKYFEMNRPVSDFCDDDITSELVEVGVTPEMPMAEASKIVKFEIWYDDNFEFSHLVLNPGGYMHRNLDAKTEIYGPKYGKAYHQALDIPGYVYMAVGRDKKVSQVGYSGYGVTVVDQFLPTTIYPEQYLIDVYQSVFVHGYDPEEGEDAIEWDEWWEVTADQFGLKA